MLGNIEVRQAGYLLFDLVILLIAFRAAIPSWCYHNEPPDTVRSCMVIPLACSLQRNAAKAAISDG